MERYDMTKEKLDAVTPEREARGAGGFVEAPWEA